MLFESIKNTVAKYSILMSVYAEEKAEYLIESIDSMLRQTVPAEQFIIVEDGPLGKYDVRRN